MFKYYQTFLKSLIEEHYRRLFVISRSMMCPESLKTLRASCIIITTYKRMHSTVSRFLRHRKQRAASNTPTASERSSCPKPGYVSSTRRHLSRVGLQFTSSRETRPAEISRDKSRICAFIERPAAEPVLPAPQVTGESVILINAVKYIFKDFIGAVEKIRKCNALDFDKT